MARRITTTQPARAACAVSAAIIAALVALNTARGQNALAQTPLSRACQAGAGALAGETSLPNVAVALAQRKTLRILAMGAAPGRVTTRGSYTELIEAMLENTIKGTDVIMISRGVSGELAANAASRMKNEVALEEPDLVLWQVGTNDALAYVDAGEFAATVKDQIDWLKAHNVDVVLVGLQFAPEILRDAHYIEIRETLRQVAVEENVIIVRFFEAMQIIEQAQREGAGPIAEHFERNDAGYNCLAQYVARAITLGVFAKAMPKREQPQPNSAT
jgi:acyl-CoA thioesterase-1